MKNRILFSVIFLTAAGCIYGQNVAATTSVLASVIRELGKDKIETATLVPSGSCPGHFDIKARHLEIIETGGILFAHGFEEYLDKIKQAVSNERFEPFLIEVEGSWLVPEVQKQMYGKITVILSGCFPELADFFTENKKAAEREIEMVDKNIQNISALKNLSEVSLICNAHIKEVLEYMGFKVVAVYGRKEDLTPPEIKELIKLGREKDIKMVVDNLQAGSDTGKVISSALQIPHAAISNFPGFSPESPTLRHTLYSNLLTIIAAYEQAKNQAY